MSSVVTAYHALHCHFSTISSTVTPKSTPHKQDVTTVIKFSETLAVASEMEVIERSCDVVEESTEPSRNETKTAKNNDKAVVYLSITVATLVVVILAGVLVWFVSRSKRKAKKK